MAIVGIRDLNRDTKGVVERLLETGEPVILTRQGQPIATILPLDRHRVNDLVISTAPELVQTMRRAEEQFEAGETRSLDDVSAERVTRRAGEKQAVSELPAGEELASSAAAQVTDLVMDEAKRSGVLAAEGDEREAELVDTIRRVNHSLFVAAMAAENLRAVESALGSASAEGATAPEPAALADLASRHVININRALLNPFVGSHELTLVDYVDKLRDASATVAAVASPATVEG
jgi:antitoxin (DNA-binding transcriptional repressor) of toxin-antitoxin stability system